MTQYIESSFGYAIPYRVCMGGTNKTLLICHGFAGSKDGPMAEALHNTFPPLGVTTYSFDLPAHGESSLDGLHLRVANCLSDLQQMEAHIIAQNPDVELSYFASSFGAYLLLLSFAQYPHRGRAALLRSTAVDMHKILCLWQDEGMLDFTPAPDGLPANDICSLDAFYGRSFFITRGFVDETAENQLMSLHSHSTVPALYMIHGAADALAPLSTASAFAARTGAQLRVLSNATHRLMEADELAAVLAYCKDSLFSSC